MGSLGVAEKSFQLKMNKDKDNSVSFFPSTKEVTIGIKWIKEHPVIATASAAASTAISLIGYLRKDSSVVKKVISWSEENGAEGLEKENGEACMLKRTKTGLGMQKMKHAENPEVGSCVKGDEVNRSSPQWGWYVAITPPQDQYAAGNNNNKM